MSFIIVGGSIAIAAGVTKLIMASQGRKERRAEQKAAKIEMEKKKREYAQLDTTNLAANVKNQFTNMENTFEDMTVNQQQAQFEAEQIQQQQANIMDSLRGAAGGSGIAALAQTMANQGQLATRRASASIGAQEAQIQQLRAGEASKLQMRERLGEQEAEATRLAGAEQARSLQWQKTDTQYGISQQRTAAANQAIAEAKAQQMEAVGQIGSAAMQTGIAKGKS